MQKKLQTYHFVINPTAGAGKAIKVMAEAEKFMIEAKMPYKTYYTDRAGDGTVIANNLELAANDVVVFVGGDGSFGEGVAGLKNKEKTQVAFLPAGTGNDFCTALGYGKSTVHNLQRIVSAKPKKIDYILGPNGNIALNTVSTGLDIDVIERYNKLAVKTKSAYTKCLLKVLLNFKFKKLKIDVDGKELVGEFMLAAVCNGNQFGGGIKASPLSDIADGKLDLLAIHKVPKIKILFLLLKFLKGKHIGRKWATHILCNRVKITNHQGQIVTSNYDGELKKDIHLDCKIVKGGLLFKY